MGVGAHARGHAAVEVPAHSDLLARRLGVHVDEHVRRAPAQVRQRRVDLGERRARGRDEQGAREVDHGECHAVALEHRDAAAGARTRVVGRAHDALLAVEERVDLRVAEGVVAQRQRIDTEAEQLARGALGDPDAAGGVLAVDHDEIRPVALAQAGQQRGKRAPAEPAHDVADKQEPHRAQSLTAGALPCALMPESSTSPARAQVGPGAGAAVLEARDLVKRYGDREALRGVSLRADRGELVAVIGPNGAGKTTLLSILAGIARPDSGSVSLGPAQVGWVPQQAAVYGKLTVAENLRLFARLERVRDPEQTVLRMLELTRLGDRAEEQVAHLSGGNRQRVNIAIGLLGGQPVLLLDEPSAALDPRQRERVWEFVGSLAAEGTAVVYSTHNVQEAERHAQRVIVLADGELLFEGSPSRLEDAVEREASARGDFEQSFVCYLRQRGH